MAAPFGEFEDYLRELPQQTTGIANPVQHVRNQLKETISIFVDAFQNETFRIMEDQANVEDAYEVYAMDFVLDETLAVSLHVAWTDTTEDGEFEALLLEDYYFLLEKKHTVYYGMIKLLMGIWDKQEKGENILPLKDTGMWELVVAQDWKYRYDGYSPQGRRRPICRVDNRVQKLAV
jgi:hypothetical protein